MGKRQYNSAADRKWQQRYQRIQERKENSFDFETPREERRKAKRTLYRMSGLDVDRMVQGNVAVLCNSPEEVRKLYRAVELKRPEYTRYISEDELVYSLYFCTEPAVAIVTEDYAFFEETSIKTSSKRYFISKGFDIVDFAELTPVVDLGEFRGSSDPVESLLGI